jgi:hypothetical protein
MKKMILTSIAVAGLMLGGCAELNMLIPTMTPKSSGLTTDEVISGLKEALTVGAANSVTKASAINGFYGNSQLFIPFPPEAITVKNALIQAGLSNLITNFEKSLNLAAEEASKKSLPIFKNAILSMTITDAMGILQGSDNAATMYLKNKTEDDLTVEFAPVIKNAIQTAKVTSYWNPIATSYNKIATLTGASQVQPNLEEYITQRTLDGLFLLIAQEEREIRQDPAARVTDILKKVFAAQ